MGRAWRWGAVLGLSLELLALGVWVGGLVVLIGAVIPAVFNTLGGQDSGGFLLTRTFEGYNRLVAAAFLILVVVAGCRWRYGDAALAVTKSEAMLLVCMGLIAAAIIFVLHPLAATLQAEAFAAKDEQARKAAFEAFFRLHMPVRSLYMVNLGLGMGLLVMKAKRSLR
ncbi:conserved membrane protein of unknown function [Nitrospira sp. KM1]|uniref:DUF4149 domain-containing protein n=1 Tax=Nitrospira sp. KM1 TaxID=1936990 RepID=UPI0013A77376|nr:DUF4149 domain-containing protein [Nitrospira sp. KM1]BCA54061.1 conserved membrane protein of unknown function [Nitrospira sp. KM1]